MNTGIAMYAEKDFSNEAGTVVSGETKIEKLEHKFTWVDWKEATCTEDGNRGYWHCESCGKIMMIHTMEMN